MAIIPNQKTGNWNFSASKVLPKGKRKIAIKVVDILEMIRQKVIEITI